MSIYTKSLISVVLTTRNRPESLLRAIRSVFAQTYKNYDLHIVDDGSTDDTPEVVKQELNGRDNAFYWRHENRRGLSAARNTGIAKSSGEFVAFLDDDDEWKPNSLEKRMQRIQGMPRSELERLGVIYSGCETRMPYENRITYNHPRIRGNIASAIRTVGISTIPSTGLHPRVALEKIGGFDEHLISSVDHDLWMMLASQGFHAVAVDEALTITYILKKRKGMVTDTRPRIRGVEQYLQKWESLYTEWYGNVDAASFIKHYRTNVLGRLCAKKLVSGAFVAAWRLGIHVLKKNRWSSREGLRLLGFILFFSIRHHTPKALIAFVKGEPARNARA